MKTKHITSILLISLFSSVHAQITFDLGDKKTRTETIDSDKEPILLIKNILPDQESNKYFIDIQKEEQPIAPIEISSLAGSGCSNAVAELKEAIRNLKNAKEENDIEDRVAELNTIIKKNNTPENKDCIALAKKIIASTETKIGLGFKIRDNQTITILVTRISNKPDTVVWKRIFKTTSTSPWNIMYGFTFVPNMMNPVSNYFSKADTSGKLYTITRLNNQKNYFLKNASPTIMITWRPLTKYSWKYGGAKSILSNNVYQLGWVGGISLNFASDITNASVLIGPSLIFATNLSISAGITATQKNVLKGKYQEEDVISDNLDFGQLHDKTFMAEWFVSLSFRFNGNPFNKTDAAGDKSSSDK